MNVSIDLVVTSTCLKTIVSMPSSCSPQSLSWPNGQLCSRVWPSHYTSVLPYNTTPLNLSPPVSHKRETIVHLRRPKVYLLLTGKTVTLQLIGLAKLHNSFLNFRFPASISSRILSIKKGRILCEHLISLSYNSDQVTLKPLNRQHGRRRGRARSTPPARHCGHGQQRNPLLNIDPSASDRAYNADTAPA